MSYRILIVDDSSVTRAVLKKTIGMTDCPVEHIVEAANGKEALEVLRTEKVDIIMADLNMPEMNGLDMLKHIQEDSELSHIPLVVISTEAHDGRIDALFEQGIKDYIHKPFKAEQIREMLCHTLGVDV